MKQQILLYLKIVLLLLFTLNCLAESKKVKKIRVGIIVPISGDYAKWGDSINKSFELANQNEKGSELEIILEDNKSCQSNEAVTAFQKLTSIDHVDIIVTFCTAAAQAVLPLAKSKKIPLIQITAAGEDPEGYMLKLMPNSNEMARILAKQIFKKYKSVILVGNTTEVNTGLNGSFNLFTTTFIELGGKIILTEDFADSQLDFRSFISKIKRIKSEAVVPFFWPTQQMSTFLLQADEQNLWENTKLGGSYVFEFMFNELSKLYPKLSQLNGLDSVNLSSTMSDKFIQQYKLKFQTEPIQFSDYAYDAASIIKKCKLDRLCFLKPRAGASGLLKFTNQGWRLGEFITKELQAGKFQVIP